MTTAELYALAEKYDAKAETAFRNYQETGISRYDRERIRHEDLAQALRIAASAKDDHDALVDLRCCLADLGHRAQAILNRHTVTVDEAQTLLRDVAASASLRGLIKREPSTLNERS